MLNGIWFYIFNGINSNIKYIGCQKDASSGIAGTALMLLLAFVQKVKAQDNIQENLPSISYFSIPLTAFNALDLSAK